MGYKEKLKIQFSIYLKNHAYIIISMVMFAVAEGMANVTTSIHLSLNINNYYIQENQVVFNIMLAFLLLGSEFIRLYSETASYFINIGFTRRRYYLGNVVATLVTSLLISAACFTTFFLTLKLDTRAEHYKYIQCFGYKFASFNVFTAIQILILTIALYILVCMLANLAGILGMMLTIKGKRIVPAIMIIIFGLIIIWGIYRPTIVNYAFENFISINNSYVVYLIFLIALSFLACILGKNIFMKIDIKNR